MARAAFFAALRCVLIFGTEDFERVERSEDFERVENIFFKLLKYDDTDLHILKVRISGYPFEIFDSPPFDSFDSFEMPPMKEEKQKNPRFDPLAVTPENRLNRLYRKHQSQWFSFLTEVIESVCDEDDEFVRLADKMNLSLEEFAIVLIEKTVANQWLPLEKLIALAEEIEHIEDGAFLDCLNECLMASPETLRTVRKEKLTAFNAHFGDGEFSL